MREHLTRCDDPLEHGPEHSRALTRPAALPRSVGVPGARSYRRHSPGSRAGAFAFAHPGDCSTASAIAFAALTAASALTLIGSFPAVPGTGLDAMPAKICAGHQLEKLGTCHFKSPG